jgi:hypothetical protein
MTELRPSLLNEGSNDPSGEMYNESNARIGP